VVVAADDGVVVVPRARAADVIAAAREGEEREARSRERYAKGELSLNVNSMREALATKGPDLCGCRMIIGCHGTLEPRSPTCTRGGWHGEAWNHWE
jgi:hypothetical protein